MVGNLGNQGMLQANVTTKFSMEFFAVAKWLGGPAGANNHALRVLSE